MKRKGNIKSRDELVVAYRKYVDHLVALLIKRMHLPLEMFDELAAAGYLGLVEAAERFDFTSGSEFKTFAFLRIRGAVIDSIRRTSDLAGKAYRYFRALQAVQDLRERMLADAAMGRPRKLSQSDAQRLAVILDYAAKGALAYRLSYSDVEEEVAAIKRLDITPEDELSSRERCAILRELVKALPDNERLIIEEYYFRDKPFSQIASEHEGFSKSWVSKLHGRALERLKEMYVALADKY